MLRKCGWPNPKNAINEIDGKIINAMGVMKLCLPAS